MGFDPELIKQLVQTFRVELDEQTQIMSQGLLQLEANTPNKADVIRTIFRAAHNIKGAARSLGINNVADIAHEIESLFSSIEKEGRVVSSGTIDSCLSAIDKMQLAMQAFCDEKPLTFDLEAFKLTLSGEAKSNTPKPIEQTAEIKEEVKPKSESGPKQEAVVKQETIKKQDSIRVTTQNLDKISAIVEEIQVNKIAIDDHATEINQLDNKLKQFSYLWRQVQTALLTELYQNDAIKKWSLTCADMLSEIQNQANSINKAMRSRSYELSTLSNSLQEEIRTLQLVPASNLFYNFPRYVRDLCKELGKKVKLTIHGDEVKIDKMILENLKDPLLHLIRNAVDHGIESPKERQSFGKEEEGHITITITEKSGLIAIALADDGQGINVDKLKQVALQKKMIPSTEINLSREEALDLIFVPGISTKDIITDVSGRGVGMDVVRSNLASINGSIEIESEDNKGTLIKLLVPLTLSSQRGLLVKASDQFFVVPTHAVQKVMAISHRDIQDIEGSQVIIFNNHPVALRKLSDILKLENTELPNQALFSVFIIKKGRDSLALIVDEIIGEREIVIKNLQPPLNNVDSISGGTLSGSNSVILVLDPNDITTLASHLGGGNKIVMQSNEPTLGKQTSILIVDDSITTRTLEKNVLESKNYAVTVAVNGKEAWDLLQKQTYDLLITDVNMPIMDGFTLTQLVKEDDKLKSMPVIIVTSLGSETEKKRGVDVGADAYIVKNEFESSILLEVISQLI